MRIKALTSLTVQCFPPSFATVGIKAGVLEASIADVGLPASCGVGERHRYGLPALGGWGRERTERMRMKYAVSSRLVFPEKDGAEVTLKSNYWLLMSAFLLILTSFLLSLENQY